MTRYIVATVEEIPPGGRKIVEVAGRSIGVFNLDGEFFALRNRCPHQGGPLCAGSLGGLISAPRPGEYQYSRRARYCAAPGTAGSSTYALGNPGLTRRACAYGAMRSPSRASSRAPSIPHQRRTEPAARMSPRPTRSRWSGAMSLWMYQRDLRCDIPHGSSRRMKRCVVRVRSSSSTYVTPKSA